jgi:hypothetical protein
VPLEDDKVSAELVDSGGNPVSVIFDGTHYLLKMSGQVVVAAPPLPSGATAIAVAADNPLSLTGGTSPHDTTYTIANGQTFYLQQFVAGCEGDPTSNGSKAEIIFDDGAEHVVDRIYVDGFTNYVAYNDVCTARDGTTMVGNGSNTIIVRRTRMSASGQEVDAVARGYEV